MWYELSTTLVRQFLLLVAGMLAAKGYFENSLIEPFVGFGLAVFALGWMLVYRKLFPKKKKGSENVDDLS